MTYEQDPLIPPLRWLAKLSGHKPEPPNPPWLSTAIFTGYGDTCLDIEADVTEQARKFFPEGADIRLRRGWHASNSGRGRGSHTAFITVERWS